MSLKKYTIGMAAVVVHCLSSGAAHAEAVNPEDAPIEDTPPITAPADTTPATDSPTTTDTATPTADTPTPQDDTPVTITKSQWEQFLARQQQLEKELAALKSQTATAPATLPAEDQSLDDTPASTTRPASGNRSLLLPDISLVTTGKFNGTNDRRDENRNRFSLEEAEIGIQGYVYPNVRADAFIVAAPGEGEAFNIEEGYLTFIGLRKNLNLVVGRKFAPFGRTGEQHPHSWLYSRQLLARQNLVAGENLSGDGLLVRYLLPTGKKLFANLDLGVFNAAEGEEGVISNDPSQITSGPGASFTNRFYTARLWASKAIGRNNELEVGASWARGDSALHNEDFDLGAIGKSQVTGADITWRRFFSGPKRLLLRSEYFRYQPKGDLRGIANSASGYYALANYRFNKRDDVGLLYEKSGFPGNNDHEKALSLIYTRQFTEQFYFRLQAIRGDRPGGNYNQVIGQLTWGLGPHTHNLE